jgi:hypothetical protein
MSRGIPVLPLQIRQVRETYQTLSDNIALLEASYFEETVGVDTTVLPLGRVLVPSKKKAHAVQPEQRIFSLSSTSGGSWPEARETSKAFFASLMDGLNARKAKTKRLREEKAGDAAASKQRKKGKPSKSHH